MEEGRSLSPFVREGPRGNLFILVYWIKCNGIGYKVDKGTKDDMWGTLRNNPSSS